MRQTLLALLLAAVGGFGLASCGSSSNNNGDMGKDMSGGGVVDMALPKLNCLGVGNCVLQCVIAGTGDINSCFTMCSKQGKTGSANKWAAAFSCGQDYCAPPSDMIGKCVSVTIPAGQPGAGGQILCDPGKDYTTCQSTTSTSCIPCLNNARNLIFGDFTDPQNPGPPTGMCPDPASPDCKGGAMCMTMMNACIGDP